MSHPQSLFTRDKLQEFSALRRAAQQQAEWLAGPQKPRANNNPNDLQDGHDKSDSHAVSGNGDISASSPPPTPPWIRALQHFVELENTIHLKIERLHAQQREFFLPRFLSDEEEEAQQQEIDKHAQGIQTLLRELDRMIVAGMRQQDPTNSEELRASVNAKRHLSSRLADLIHIFKDGQELYAAQLKRREEKRRKFKQIGSMESHERLEREEKTAQYLELGYTQMDIQELLLEEAKHQAISKEIEDVVSSITELHEMFKDLSTLVVEQGSVLDRIDFNVQQTQKDVTRGVEELKKARVKQESCQLM